MPCSGTLWPILKIFTARCTLLQSAVLRSHVVCPSSVCRPSVTLVDCDHIGWNSSEIISPLVSLGCSLSADPNIRYSKGNTQKFWPKVKLGHDWRLVRTHRRHDATRLRCRQIVQTRRDSSRLSPTSREFNTHRRRDSTRQLRRVGVGGVYWA